MVTETTEPTRWTKYFVGLSVLLIFVGLFPTRDTVIGWQGLAVIPWLPVFAGVILYLRGFHWSENWALLAVVMILFVGGPVTFLVGVLHSSAGFIIMFKGLLIMVVICALAVLLNRDLSKRSRLYAIAIMTVVTVIAGFSILSAILVVAKTEIIRENKPFCIAQKSSENMKSYAGLRAGSFFVDVFNKDGRRFEDAMLVVEGSHPKKKLDFFEWVLESQTFRPFTPPISHHRLHVMCEPMAKFWSKLRIW